MQENNEINKYTYKGRVQKLFGIHIPPKKVLQNHKCVTLRFRIVGSIPSKKNDFIAGNNYKAIRNFAFASANPKQYLDEKLKAHMVGSRKYLNWLDEMHDDFMSQVGFWRDKYNLEFPLNLVSIHTCYFFANDYKTDIINKDESIYDMLVAKKIIADDNYSILFKTSSEAHNMKDDLPNSVCVIDLTYYYK
jgi:hypothetical protein